MEFLFQNKTVIITWEWGDREGAVLSNYIELDRASEVGIGNNAGTGGSLVDPAVPEVDASSWQTVSHGCWSSGGSSVYKIAHS